MLDISSGGAKSATQDTDGPWLHTTDTICKAVRHRVVACPHVASPGVQFRWLRQRGRVSGERVGGSGLRHVLGVAGGKSSELTGLNMQDKRVEIEVARAESSSKECRAA